MHSILKPYYLMSRGASCAGVEVYKLIKYRTEKSHIAYHLAGETRWHISGPMSESLADLLMGVANEDLNRGNYKLVTLRHRLRILAIEGNPARWKKHRNMMARRREEAAMAVLPGYGMF